MKKVTLLFVFLLTSLAGFSENLDVTVGTLKYTIDTNAHTATVTGTTDESMMGWQSKVYYAKSLVIPESITVDGTNYAVTAIGDNAFKECEGYRYLTIPGSVVSIGNYAFYKNTLDEIIIPEGVKTIGEYAFAFSYIARWIDLPSTLTSIGDYAFHNMYDLSVINSHLENLFELAYDARNIFDAETINALKNDFVNGHGLSNLGHCKTTLYVPSGLKTTYNNTTGWSLYENVVEGNVKKATVNNVDYIYSPSTQKASVFRGGHSLTSVEIPAQITIEGTNYEVEGIWDYALRGGVESDYDDSSTSSFCPYLRSVKIAEGVKHIGYSSFLSFEGKIVLPSTINSLDKSALNMNSGSIISNIQTPFETIDWLILENNDVTLYVPQGKKDAYSSLQSWNRFKSILETSVDNESETLYAEKDDNTVAIVSNESTDASVDIPKQLNGKDVSEISANAFAGKTGVTDIVLPETEKALELGTNALKIDDDHVATVHVPLSLLVDYALNEELKQNFEAGKVVATITAPNQYWTFSSGVDVLVPDGVKVYICKAINGSDIQIVELTDAELTVDGKKVIKANNGVLISSTSGNAYDLVAKSGAQASGTIPAAFDNANSYEGNKLVPVVRSQNYDPDQYYMLYNGGFVKIADGDVSKTPACRALLKK